MRELRAESKETHCIDNGNCDVDTNNSPMNFFPQWS
jgi:hypothetical protein